MKLSGLFPISNSCIFCERFIYSTIVLPIFGCGKIGGPILGIYKSLTDTYVEIWNEATQFYLLFLGTHIYKANKAFYCEQPPSAN
jgi:hypothetical protein